VDVLKEASGVRPRRPSTDRCRPSTT
jgi:hypothetical protein